MSRTKRGELKAAGWKFLLVIVAIALAVTAGIFYLFLPVNRGEIPHYFATADSAKT